MKLISLMYHNIEPQTTTNRYSFSIDQFKCHLTAIKTRVGYAPAIIKNPCDTVGGFVLTFDDGRKGMLLAAELLQSFEWKAFFFITSNAIGKTGFLNKADIKLIAQMGHVIGSHSADHPACLSGRDFNFIKDQWSQSKMALEDLLGHEVITASVPFGFYNKKVGRAADEAGLNYLFTSEPVVKTWNVGQCRILGRYMLTNGMRPRTIAAVAGGAYPERFCQYLAWNLRKPFKLCMRHPYAIVRKYLNRTKEARLSQ